MHSRKDKEQSLLCTGSQCSTNSCPNIKMSACERDEGAEAGKGMAISKALLQLFAEPREDPYQHAHVSITRACPCGSASPLIICPGCIAGLASSWTSPLITESEFTQGSVSYGHLGKRSASTCKRRNSLKSEKNLHVPAGYLRGAALLTPPWKRRLWHKGTRTSEER